VQYELLELQHYCIVLSIYLERESASRCLSACLLDRLTGRCGCGGAAVAAGESDICQRVSDSAIALPVARVKGMRMGKGKGYIPVRDANAMARVLYISASSAFIENITAYIQIHNYTIDRTSQFPAEPCHIAAVKSCNRIDISGVWMT